MSVSVVITTYNGEKYIVDQLESLRNQTRKIDEVLIYDDGSTDSTSMIVENFIKDFKLENWHFIVNKKKQGLEKKFS
jgi:glycosyltransferase involved in cell wall biosynthesis